MEKSEETNVPDGEELLEALEPKTEKEESNDDDAHEDASLKHEDDSEEQESDGDTDEEAEAKRERNRKRRHENKERKKEYVDSLRRELAARDELLQQALDRLGAIENRSNQTDIAALDNEIKKTADAYNYFKNQINLAVQQQNGAVVADATEKMIKAQRKYEQLAGVKQAVSQQRQSPAPLDPRVKSNAEAWLSRNSWYDPMARDQDSRIVKQLDNDLAAEGWNPTTEQYFKELDARIKKYLPHKVSSRYDSGKSRSPVAGSGRETSNSNATSSYRLSAERVQAMKDAGIYDDPKARAEAIKRYQAYDKRNQA